MKPRQRKSPFADNIQAGRGGDPHDQLEVVRDHIRSAIQMMSIGTSARSVHLLVMATEEMIRSLARRRDILLSFEILAHIRDDYRTEWLRITKRSYNHFKHADREPDSELPWPTTSDLELLNEISTLYNIRGFRDLTGSTPEEMSIFASVMVLKHPHLFKLDEMIEQFAGLRDFDFSGHKAYVPTVLREHLYRLNLLPRVPTL